MKKVLIAMVMVIGVAAALVAVHFLLIEVGREVVVVSVTDAAGEQHSRRLWAVDYDGAVWLHSAGDAWHQWFAAPTVVELERDGVRARYRAVPVPGPHPEIDRALREKYGIADRWVRWVAPDNDQVLVVRLEPLTPQTGE